MQRHWPAIIEYAYVSRFVIASQVQRRFARELPSARTTHWHLAGLVERGYLATAPVRSTSPNFPFVYYATGRGVGLVNETYASLGTALRYPPGEGCKKQGLALQGILHEVLTSEFELAVQQEIERRADLKLLLTERRYFRSERRLQFTDQRGTHCVIPDAGFLLAKKEGSNGTSHNVDFTSESPPGRQGTLFLVEFDNGTMPPARFGRKLRQYGRWAESEDGQRYLQQLFGRFGLSVPRSGFRLLVIAHDKLHADSDEKRLAALFTQALLQPAAMRDRLWFAAASDLKALQQQSPPPNARIWCRGRAAKGWLPEFWSFPERNANALRRQLVLDRLPFLDRSALLPSPIATSPALQSKPTSCQKAYKSGHERHLGGGKLRSQTIETNDDMSGSVTP